jgi:hypothetical protein
MSEDRAALLDQRTRGTGDRTGPEGGERTSSGPRRWSDPDEKAMLKAMLFFFVLALYAGVFVAFGVSLTT